MEKKVIEVWRSGRRRRKRFVLEKKNHNLNKKISREMKWRIRKLKWRKEIKKFFL